MKLTWTFYPKGQPSVTLTVVYLPKLDEQTVGGYLHVETNTAYVSWAQFSLFNRGDQATKRDLFGSLIRIHQLDSLNGLGLPS